MTDASRPAGPLLSVCIPTHHGRAAVLDRLLGVLEDQLTPDVRGRVEVCVSDNGSGDATSAVLARRRATLGAPLVTHRFERNGGFTVNLLKVVEIARGNFGWLIGSDDLIAPGAIAKVLVEDPDLAGITTNRVRVNFFDPRNELRDAPDELPSDPELPHIYEHADEIFLEVGLLHDYISTQIFSRALFDEVAAATSAHDLEAANHFAHLLLLGRMVQRRPRWMWLPDALVQHTTGTSALDEDLDYDYTGYQLTVMEGRHTVWSMLLGSRSPLYKGVMTKAYRRTARQPMVLLGLKLAPNHTLTRDVALLAGLTRYFFWHRTFWVRTVPLLLIPHQLVKALRYVRERMPTRTTRSGTGR
jgi:abequosyltransferase